MPEAATNGAHKTRKPLRLRRVPEHRTTTTFVLRREGSFHCQFTGNKHCGTENALIVKFAAQITCRSTLNKRGFVIDQDDLSAYFKKIQKTTLSCEELAEHTARQLWDRVSGDGLRVQRIAIQISPPPYVGSAEAILQEV